MNKISRDDIYAICQSSDIAQPTLEKALQEKVYANKSDWSKFLKLLFLTLGAGFFVTGIIFFMAYNWQDLNKFIKLGIVETLIIASVLFVLCSKLSLQVKNITLTASSLLVGALFAVFGQIYQTGANAYDFFLGWTVFITVWVLVANYAPLWLLFSVLLNTTFYFFTEQVVSDWPTSFIYLLFVLLNATILISFSILNKFKSDFQFPNWYRSILAIAIASFSTILIVSIDDDWDESKLNTLYLLIIIVLYAIGILEAKRLKNILNIALIALSIIVSVLYFLISGIDDEGQLLLIALFSVATFSLSVKLLMDLQKNWNHAK